MRECFSKGARNQDPLLSCGGGGATSLAMLPGAILFDFDGVILDTEWSIYESMLEVFQENGHDLPLEDYGALCGGVFFFA